MRHEVALTANKCSFHSGAERSCREVPLRSECSKAKSRRLCCNPPHG